MQKAPLTAAIRAVIIHELEKSGITIRSKDGSTVHTEGGVRITFAATRRENYWARGDDKTRFIRLEVGYGEGMNRSYPLRKDDTFNVAKIVQTVGEFEKQKAANNVRRDERAERARALEAQKQEAAVELSESLHATAEELATYGKPSYGGHQLKMDDDVRVGVRTGGEVFITIQGLTADRAKKILAALAGI
tara:strand:+ start:1136 stop:1708 length:573 start_codon:yes stop_codon:yes gene_type:complete